jgi:hypothetical protein
MWQAEISRIKVWSQPRQTHLGDLIENGKC